jgi:hypothetical protein
MMDAFEKVGGGRLLYDIYILPNNLSVMMRSKVVLGLGFQPSFNGGTLECDRGCVW